MRLEYGADVSRLNRRTSTDTVNWRACTSDVLTLTDQLTDQRHVTLNRETSCAMTRPVAPVARKKKKTIVRQLFTLLDLHGTMTVACAWKVCTSLSVNTAPFWLVIDQLGSFIVRCVVRCQNTLHWLTGCQLVCVFFANTHLQPISFFLGVDKAL